MMLTGTAIFLAHAEIALGNCVPFSGTITVSSNFPCDIPGGASNAALDDAAKFAWQEFIALNWPAKIEKGTAFKRETPDDTLLFGDPKNTGPLVWHTYRGKVEIYPGEGMPPGYKNSGAGDYGYDALPQYVYGAGEIKPASGIATPSDQTPWVNLDENSQIFVNQIFAGTASSVTESPKNQILFMAKANRKEYSYIAANKWWGEKMPPFMETMNYIKNHAMDPPQASSDYVSFPTNTVEIKAAWRKLGENDDPSHYYQTTVRYYVKGSDGVTKYKDEKLALIGMHIIHKTATAPYFTYATFEHAGNILDANGNPVEGLHGSGTGDTKPSPMNPAIFSFNAQGKSYQTFNQIPDTDFPGDPGKQLYYQNTPDTGIPTKGYPGKNQELSNIIVNRRINSIPKDIVDVNRQAYLTIITYAAKYSKTGETPLRYYRLTNVQYKPIDKPDYGVDYNGTDAATYYQSNSVIETDYNLQRFSGRFYAKFESNDPHKFTVTDFDESGKKFQNVAYNGTLSNMGGCMGCHGNIQKFGAGFSFILKNGRVAAPEAANVPVTPEQVARFAKYFSAPTK